MANYPWSAVLAPMGKGGGIVNAMSGIRSLEGQGYENELAKWKAKYAPQTLQAEAASKMAYANLMGPQFMAKLLENQYTAGNMSKEQYDSAMQGVMNAGQGAGGSQNALSGINQSQGDDYGSSNPLGWLRGKLQSGLNSLTNAASQQSQMGQKEPQVGQAVQGDFKRLSAQEAEAAMENYVQNKALEDWALKTGKPATDAQSEQAFNEYKAKIQANPQLGQQLLQEAAESQPDIADYLRRNDSLPSQDRQETISPEQDYSKNATPGENVGAMQGSIERGKENARLTTQRQSKIAEAIPQLSMATENLSNLAKAINSEDYRQKWAGLPYLREQSAKFSKELGNPETQQIIGNIEGLQGKIIADMAASLGKISDNKISFAKESKVSLADPIPTQQSKLYELIKQAKRAELQANTEQRLLEQRGMTNAKASRLTNDVLKQNHDRLEAEAAAEAYGVSLEDLLHTAQKRGMSPVEVARKIALHRSK